MRLGNGPRARLRFDLDRARATLTQRQADGQELRQLVTGQGAVRPRSNALPPDVELLPGRSRA
jgi:hypothetical protein